MYQMATGRVGRSQWMVAALPFLFLSFFNCREQIPSGPYPGLESPHFALQLDSYCSYDNWNLDPDGFRIPTSKFRSAWRVVDTSAIVAGFPGVVIVSDSTFARDFRGNDSLVSVAERFFRTSADGDVFEWGFIARLREQHDTVQVPATWDRILSAGPAWVVVAGDSSNRGSVYATLAPAQELVGITVNGVASGILAYYIEITGEDLAVRLWVSDVPSALLRFRDDSPVEGRRIFQELTLLRNIP